MPGIEWLGENKPPIPPDEAQRLDALSRYESLHFEPARDEDFDRLAELAAEFCDVPVSFVNLISEDKQFKKACFGLKGETTPRTDSFCQYTIMQDDIFEVKDSHHHSILKNNPNVTGKLKLRYYAGILDVHSEVDQGTEFKIKIPI